MRSLLAKVGVFLSLLGFVVAMGPNSSQKNSPRVPKRYICGDVIFMEHFFDGLTKRIKRKARFNFFDSAQFKKFYNDSPFTRPYLAWPIDTKTDSYEQAMLGPYRAILKENFEVFSVVMRKPRGIQECKMIGPVAEEHQNYHYKCGNVDFPYNLLLSAVEVACLHILEISANKYPARYDGPHFSEFGEQRYVFPVKLDGPFPQGNDPGPYRAVINSKCKLVGAITVYNHGETFQCTKTRMAN